MSGMSTNDELRLRDLSFAERTLARIDRICSQYLLKELTAEQAIKKVTVTVSAWTDPK